MIGTLMSAAIWLFGAADGQSVVTLTLTEREGIGRSAEMVVTGVPLPKGRVKDAANLALIGADGKPIAAEIRPVARWLDGSVRWVHLHFPADCAASSRVTVTLAQGVASPKRPNNLNVTESPEAITVVTGPLKFVVKRRGFNLIDAAWIDEGGRGQFDERHQVIASHSKGAVVIVGGQPYAAVNDPDVTVAVEESGPMHVVIKAAGVHTNAKGEKRLDFVARLYAWAGSPAVRLVYTFINAQGSDRQVPLLAEAVNLDLPTLVKGGRATVGAEGAAKPAAAGFLVLGHSGGLRRVGDSLPLGGGNG